MANNGLRGTRLCLTTTRVHCRGIKAIEEAEKRLVEQKREQELSAKLQRLQDEKVIATSSVPSGKFTQHAQLVTPGRLFICNANIAMSMSRGSYTCETVGVSLRQIVLSGQGVPSKSLRARVVLFRMRRSLI